MSRTAKKTKCIALCALLAALGVAVLWIGSVIDVLDLSAAMFASILTVIPVIEYKKYWPWLTYGVTAAAALLLLPNKLPAVMYLLAGYYPIVKSKLEKLRRPLSQTLKFLLFNLSLAVTVIFCRLFLPSVDLSLIPGVSGVWNYMILFAVGNGMFFLYDLMLSKMILLYIIKLRKKLGMKDN